MSSGSGSKFSGDRSIQGDCWHCGMQGHMQPCPAGTQGAPGQGGKSQSNSQAARFSLAGQSKLSQVSDQQGAKREAQEGSSSSVPGRAVFSGEGVQGATAVRASQLPPEPVVPVTGNSVAATGGSCVTAWRSLQAGEGSGLKAEGLAVDETD